MLDPDSIVPVETDSISPKWSCLSPKRDCLSPMRNSRSPATLSRSPGRRSRSPGRHSRSPKRGRDAKRDMRRERLATNKTKLRKLYPDESRGWRPVSQTHRSGRPSWRHSLDMMRARMVHARMTRITNGSLLSSWSDVVDRPRGESLLTDKAFWQENSERVREAYEGYMKGLNGKGQLHNLSRHMPNLAQTKSSHYFNTQFVRCRCAEVLMSSLCFQMLVVVLIVIDAIYAGLMTDATIRSAVEVRGSTPTHASPAYVLLKVSPIGLRCRRENVPRLPRVWESNEVARQPTNHVFPSSRSANSSSDHTPNDTSLHVHTTCTPRAHHVHTTYIPRTYHVRTRMRVRARGVRTHATHARTLARSHARTLARTHAHTHTRTHAHTHTRTQRNATQRNATQRTTTHHNAPQRTPSA